MTPTTALLWEIWRRQHWTVAIIGALTAAGWSLHYLEASGLLGTDPPPLVDLCGMLAFVLLFSVFNYTDAGGARGVGHFPRRLFTLPVSTLRLVMIPTVAATASVELLYALWAVPLSKNGSTGGLFVAVLLAAFVVFYLTTLWTLERAGSMRLIVLGAIASSMFAIAVLPSIAPQPAPHWRSAGALCALLVLALVVSVLFSLRHVAQLRAGGGLPDHGRLDALAASIGERFSPRRAAFPNAAAAHFWFEWRASGMLLPALVTAQVLLIIVPASWLARHDADGSFRLLLATLATPIVLSIPTGIACSKPTVWSQDLALPSFVAVRPFSCSDLVATKVKVAAVSAAASWVIVTIFLALWLSCWASLGDISQFALQIWAFHEQSTAMVYALAALIVIGGMLLTWRFLIVRLWTGLAGVRLVFVGSMVATGVVGTSVLIASTDRTSWILDEPTRLGWLVWLAAAAVIAKYWLAAFAWRSADRRHTRPYFAVWMIGTSVFLALAAIATGIMRNYAATDTERLRSLIILIALLGMPLARIGLAPSSLMRNRHR